MRPAFNVLRNGIVQGTFLLSVRDSQRLVCFPSALALNSVGSTVICFGARRGCLPFRGFLCGFFCVFIAMEAQLPRALSRLPHLAASVAACSPAVCWLVQPSSSVVLFFLPPSPQLRLDPRPSLCNSTVQGCVTSLECFLLSCVWTLGCTDL